MEAADRSGNWPMHVGRSSMDRQPALLKRICHLVRYVGWRDLVRQVLLALKGLDHLVEHRLEQTSMFEPSLVAGEVDVAVDRDPVRPVLDRQVTDTERLGLIGERRDGLFHDGSLSARTASVCPEWYPRSQASRSASGACPIASAPAELSRDP